MSYERVHAGRALAFRELPAPLVVPLDGGRSAEVYRGDAGAAVHLLVRGPRSRAAASVTFSADEARAVGAALVKAAR